jgi:L-asparaginase II
VENNGEALVEVWRGDVRESIHSGHIAIWHADQGLIGAWGDAGSIILPRSSCKMIQALPLVESGAANAFDLSSEQLALSCASHQGARVHVSAVEAWLKDLGLDDDALRCGAQWPNDDAENHALIRQNLAPCQTHNNCSGKHAGFLTLTRHLGDGPEYLEPDHKVQRAVKTAFEEVTDEASPGFAIDGCSAPNHATSLTGLARAMAQFAAAKSGSVRGDAMIRLREAMMAHPHLVAGETRACTNLMRAMGARAAIKTGAEAVFVAIVPERRIGVALKIADGATRASEAAIAQILVGLGVLDAVDPMATRYTYGPIKNWRGIETGGLRPVESLVAWRP